MSLVLEVLRAPVWDAVGQSRLFIIGMFVPSHIGVRQKRGYSHARTAHTPPLPAPGVARVLGISQKRLIAHEAASTRGSSAEAGEEMSVWIRTPASSRR